MKVGVLGLGSIGMRHATNLLSLGHEVYAYDPQVQDDRFLRWNGQPTKLLEAVVIASPTPMHAGHINLFEYTPIFVEKPVSDQPFNLHHGVLMVGYNLRFHSCVAKAKEWLDAGAINQPIWANFTCAQKSTKAGYLNDGVILNWSHEIDLARYLLGPAKVQAASVRQSIKDDLADILLTHGLGCRTTIHLDYLTEPEIRRFVIVGDKGRIEADLVRRIAWLSSDAAHVTTYIGKDSYDQNYVEEINAFIVRVQGRRVGGCTGAEGLEALAICLEARKLSGLQ